jgi:hypothetical protein
MPRFPVVAFSVLAVATTACRRSPPVPPDTEIEPPTQEDPLDGKELGESKTDEAKIVEPGPAESELRTGDELDTHPR